MNDETQCALEDLNQAADELIALGCAAGAMHIHDGVARLGFLGEVSAFVDEVIKDVKEGVISAAEGVAVFWEEQQALQTQVRFYWLNGVTLAAGAAQTTLGVTAIGTTLGAATPFGALLIAHGGNNIYEGASNILNGPDVHPAQGVTRKVYQKIVNSEEKGNIAYGALDLSLSLGGLIRSVRRVGSVQLFVRDKINYEKAYKQTGRAALLLEVFSDYNTLNSIVPAHYEDRVENKNQ